MGNCETRYRLAVQDGSRMSLRRSQCRAIFVLLAQRSALGLGDLHVTSWLTGFGKTGCSGPGLVTSFTIANTVLVLLPIQFTLLANPTAV
jgi:hypothetical protein